MALLIRARSIVTDAVNASLLLFSLACGQPAFASDWGPSPHTLIAAVSTSSTSLSERRDRTESDETLSPALGAPTTAAGRSGGEEVLAGFDSSAPETIEEEVAKAYGLELVSRLRLNSVGKRIVRFRIPDARSVTDVIAVLRADQRVTSAQANVRYQLPEQPATEISGLKQQPQARENQEKGPASAQRQGDGKTALKMPTLQRAGSLVARNHTSLRWPTADEPFVNMGVRNR